MIHRPGLAFALSFVIFVAAVLVLYRTPRFASALECLAPGEAGGVPDPALAAPVTQARAWPGELDPARHQPAQPAPPNLTPESKAARVAAVAPPAPAPVRVQKVALAHPLVPTRSFTRTLNGETFESVAARVYGSPQFANELWHANRDQVLPRDQPFRAGVVLRTPRIDRPLPGEAD